MASKKFIRVVDEKAVCDLTSFLLALSLLLSSYYIFNTLVKEAKIAAFANSVALDEVAHNEPPHLDLHCFASSL